MRVQSKQQTLRLRIDEPELERLLAGEVLDNPTTWPDGGISHQQLALADQPDWQRIDDGWRLQLVADDVRALASRLPSRDGLTVELPTAGGTPLIAQFDVDVRDSTRRRYPKP
ncbi:MAG TPA: hypothetical protein VFJ15_11175 [Oleiagrimonas sp.]|nr:hypothetical protein [Oleiagrimonas sp.]